jgi:NAD+ diphosphatase
MIQNIHPHLFSNVFVVNSAIQDNDYIFHFKENSLLLKQKGDSFEIPKKKELKGLHTEGQFLFTLNNVKCFLVWECQAPEDNTFTYHEISFLRNISQPEMDWSAAVAFHLMNWYSQNKFCGKCGSPTVSKKDERAIVCPSCQRILYPTISPAIIVAIRSNDKILLARNANFRDGFYSLVAGYVDVGESIEDAVRREVKEEVGLDIKNIRYYDSQPWPFSGSMMIGFIADGDDSQPIEIDNVEIVEAAWYSRDNLPMRPPNRSIAGEIIDKFEEGEL